jgi:hypothetical protein
VCPAQSLFDFDTAISRFRESVEAQFACIRMDRYGQIAFYPSHFRNIIMEAANNLTVLDITYDRRRREIEPIKLPRFLDLAMGGGNVPMPAVEARLKVGLIIDKRLLLFHLGQITLCIRDVGEKVMSKEKISIPLQCRMEDVKFVGPHMDNPTPEQFDAIKDAASMRNWVTFQVAGDTDDIDTYHLTITLQI